MKSSHINKWHIVWTDIDRIEYSTVFNSGFIDDETTVMQYFVKIQTRGILKLDIKNLKDDVK